MTATALVEEELRQLKREECDAFVMPRPAVGQAVVWYPSGTKESLPETAFVLRVGTKNCVIQRASGMAMESVRHINDPKLALNAFQRETGAWDFTEYDKQIQEKLGSGDSLAARVKDLEARVAQLEADQIPPPKTKPKVQSNPTHPSEP